jgi:hypothetical protein
MDAQQFQRPVIRKVVVAGGLAIIIACFATGHARAQFVNPVPPVNPTLNPSSPSVAPQTPEAPVSPTVPNSAGSSVSPDSNASMPPSVPTVAVNHDAKAAATRTARRPAVRSRHVRASRNWRRQPRYATRVVGPSYYPGFGYVYPPYPNPCHWVRAWDGAWRYWTYSCS